MTETATQWRAAWQMPGGLPQAQDETWTYVLDDPAVTAGEGWWPFYATAAWFTVPQPSGARFSPDIAHYAWYTEYVSVWPDSTEGFATAFCYVVARDGSHTSERTSFQLRLHEETGWEAQLPETCLDLEVLAEKASRLCAALNAATAARDNGEPLPNIFPGIPEPVEEETDADRTD